MLLDLFLRYCTTLQDSFCVVMNEEEKHMTMRTCVCVHAHVMCVCVRACG